MIADFPSFERRCLVLEDDFDGAVRRRDPELCTGWILKCIFHAEDGGHFPEVMQRRFGQINALGHCLCGHVVLDLPGDHDAHGTDGGSAGLENIEHSVNTRLKIVYIAEC